MHSHRHHEEVGLAGMVEETADISHGARVHNGLPKPPYPGMLPHHNDVVHISRPLGPLPPPRLLQPDHLPGVLAHKRPLRHGLQRLQPPALTVSGEHTQAKAQAPLYHPVTAGFTTPAQGVTLKYGQAVLGLLLPVVSQAPMTVVRLTVGLQAGTAPLLAGLGAAVASWECHFAWVSLTPWAWNVLWTVLPYDTD